MRLFGSEKTAARTKRLLGHFLATRRERLVSPDLYLLDSPAGAIHRRGKAELHLPNFELHQL